jgi:hypothetical protein
MNNGISEAGDFLFGHIDGEKYMVSNTAEQIAAFIMKGFPLKNIVITDMVDQSEIETSMGFIMYCRDQEFLANNLIPILAPMQMGDEKIIEFIPHQAD